MTKFGKEKRRWEEKKKEKKKRKKKNKKMKMSSKTIQGALMGRKPKDDPRKT